MKISLIIIDDEPLARAGLRVRLRGHSDFEVIAEAKSSVEAIEKIEQLRPDAVFLDIELLRSSGIDVARNLGVARPIVVFLTAHAGYALDAFDVEAADYLLKPIDETRFEMSLNRIRERVKLKQSLVSGPHALSARTNQTSSGPEIVQIAVTDRRRTRLVDLERVDWISAAGDYAELHVQGQTHLLREPLSALLKRLPPKLFHQIHRSHAVNVNKVSEYLTLRNDDLVVKLKDGTTLRASRTFSEGLRRALTVR